MALRCTRRGSAAEVGSLEEAETRYKKKTKVIQGTRTLINRKRKNKLGLGVKGKLHLSLLENFNEITAIHMPSFCHNGYRQTNII